MRTTEAEVWTWLKEVTDPEIPVLTVVDMGVVRKVATDGDNIKVSITPTYSGCPAMNEIENNIRETLMSKGFQNVEVEMVLSPPWTTDWLSEEGRNKLREFGIAPPEGTSADKRVLFGEAKKPQCPLCSSTDTEMISQFGSTACKALYRCHNCKEPFDYFKCI